MACTWFVTWVTLGYTIEPLPSLGDTSDSQGMNDLFPAALSEVVGASGRSQGNPTACLWSVAASALGVEPLESDLRESYAFGINNRSPAGVVGRE